MSRKLYLIISDGGGNTPLRGVHIDKVTIALYRYHA